MNAVDELCNLHDYIEEHFEDAEFISAETPNRSWDREMVTIRFSLGGRQYKYALSDETQEAKDEDNK